MKRNRAAPMALARIIKVGGLYWDKKRGVLVTAEDYEIRGGRRTGCIVVSAADAKESIARRWCCKVTDLEDVQEEIPLSPPGNGGLP